MIRTLTLSIIFIISIHSQTLAQRQYKDEHAGTIVCFPLDEDIFPKTWENDQINPQITALEEESQVRVKLILGNAFDKYPPKLLRKNLKKVYVLKTLSFFGLPSYGGTYNRRDIYITDNGISNGYTDKYIEGSFHHEFSSVLMKRHSKHLDVEAWNASKPAGFIYGEGGKEALMTGNTSLFLDSSLIVNGFLNEYSLASMEEDFNCYAENLFLSDDEFWEAWEQSEAVRRKTEIIIDFYNSLNSVFTLQYFRDLKENISQ
jgi:hypothetical protein